MTPSPTIFTSVPSQPAMSRLSDAKCALRTSSALSNGEVAPGSVDPASSVKRIVTLSVAAIGYPADPPSLGGGYATITPLSIAGHCDPIIHLHSDRVDR